LCIDGNSWQDAIRNCFYDTMTPQARKALDECYRILGTTPDKFRNLWTQSAPNERRVFCLIAGISPYYIDYDWLGLDPEHRQRITMRVSGMQKWLNHRLGQ
jgi:hypothetical protein